MQQDKQQDRPTPPYQGRDGESRLNVVVSAAGPVEFRPAELIVNLARIDGARQDPERARVIIQEIAGASVEIDKRDLEQARSSGYLRLRLGDDAPEVLALTDRVNAKLGEGTANVNAVFQLGALTADPMRLGSLLGADPMRLGSQFGGDPSRFVNTSTARPALMPKDVKARVRENKCGPGSATVAILDTGIPITGQPMPSDVDFKGIGDGVRDRADVNVDGYLDIAAGHSTFIRTIIERSSPTVDLMVEGVMHNDGDGDEVEVADALKNVFDKVEDKSRLILNLSFSGYYPNDVEPPLIAWWIRQFVAAGAVVVAAAGNDGHCRPKFPAAMPEVLSVGALGACGPAPFSNHGHWVDCSAPGEDLISEFFDKFDGAFEPVEGSTAPDIDDFSGWAMWSGTSFATPAVVGALAEIVELYDCTGKEAVNKLVKTPGLFRIPDYGVVVNRIF